MLSLAELNMAIAELVEDLNARPMRSLTRGAKSAGVNLEGSGDLLLGPGVQRHHLASSCLDPIQSVRKALQCRGHRGR